MRARPLLVRALLVRALLVAGLATFLLPSCFTMALWENAKPTEHEEPLAFRAHDLRIATAVDGTVVAIALQLEPATQPFGPEAAGCWLWLHGFDAPKPLTSFFRAVQDGRVQNAQLHITLAPCDLGSGPPDRATFTNSGRPLGESQVDPALFDMMYARTTCRIEVRRELDPMPLPTSATAAFSQQYRTTSVIRIAGAVVLTPVSVVCDVITLPLQLVAMIVMASTL